MNKKEPPKADKKIEHLVPSWENCLGSFRCGIEKEVSLGVGWALRFRKTYLCHSQGVCFLSPAPGMQVQILSCSCPCVFALPSCMLTSWNPKSNQCFNQLSWSWCSVTATKSGNLGYRCSRPKCFVCLFFVLFWRKVEDSGFWKLPNVISKAQ